MISLKETHPGSLWSIYSCINSLCKLEHNIDLNNYHKLRKVMKGLTADHVAKKAAVFTKEEIETIVRALKNEGKN